MDTKGIPWNQGSWTTKPVSVSVEDGCLKAVAENGSDYWEKTLYEFEHRNGHALLVPWEDSHAVEVTFRLDSFTELYDQAGLMLWYGQEQWIKAGVEINDGVPHLAVVVTDGYSDWSLAPVSDWAGQEVTIRASRMKDAVILRARSGSEGWRTIRVARFPYPEGKQAGPFFCAPTRSGLEVVFTRWVQTAPDAELHMDPPIEE
ncbi:DUF1349 domain-containing protein [Paenibacillus sp. 1011MAR3C5]|uniref:DUF1349 domain-containing protein n=1 Tax=Paenibacillus sp. 1011MAR3C5 TaxID=1675787 RepID=UPI000E6D23CB|nr:DUF1349 domain-containing protein [Paenibacillus sp. 1011MAR3C5]RJE83892.1 DUF1349 domain-containing protein [Paenibacillus sp. 1011MAR3C5]